MAKKAAFFTLLISLCFLACIAYADRITLAVGDSIEVTHSKSELSSYTYSYSWEITSGADCVRIVSGSTSQTCTITMQKAGTAKIVGTQTRKKGTSSYTNKQTINLTIVSQTEKTKKLTMMEGGELDLNHYMYTSEHLIDTGDISKNMNYRWEIVSGGQYVYFQYNEGKTELTGSTFTGGLSKKIYAVAPGKATIRCTVWHGEDTAHKFVYTANVTVTVDPSYPRQKTDTIYVKMDYDYEVNHTTKKIEHYMYDLVKDTRLKMTYEWRVLTGAENVKIESDTGRTKTVYESDKINVFGDMMGEATIQGIARNKYAPDSYYVYTLKVVVTEPNYPQNLGTNICTKCNGAGREDCFCIYYDEPGECPKCKGSGFYAGKKCPDCDGSGKHKQCGGNEYFSCLRCKGTGYHSSNAGSIQPTPSPAKTPAPTPKATLSIPSISLSKTTFYAGESVKLTLGSVSNAERYAILIYSRTTLEDWIDQIIEPGTYSLDTTGWDAGDYEIQYGVYDGELSRIAELQFTILTNSISTPSPTPLPTSPPSPTVVPYSTPSPTPEPYWTPSPTPEMYATPSPTPEPGRVGDFNGDHILDWNDAVRLLTSLCGGSSSGIRVETADMNGDKTVNIDDLLVLIQYCR